MHDRFVAALEKVYDAAPDPSLWPAALQAVADVFDDVGAVMVYSRDDGGFGAISSPSVQSMVIDAAENFNGQDLRAIRGVERGIFYERDAVTDRHVVTQDEILGHPYYLMMARHGLRYFAGVPVSPDARVNIAISVQRSIKKPPFEDDELEQLTRLGRHVERSLSLSIRLLDTEMSNLGLREALSRLSVAVFALDSLQRVVFRNDAAERLLGSGLEVVNGYLKISPAAGRQLLEDTLRSVLAGTAEDLVADPRPILLERDDTSRPLTIYVLPIRGTASHRHEFLTHTRALVLGLDPLNEPANPALVRDLFGLTLGEARVAALIATGISPRAAAPQLGLTEESARTILKRIFVKTGVSRQSELAGLLAKLVLR